LNTTLHPSPAPRPRSGRALARLALVVWSALWMGGVALGQGSTEDVGTWLRDGNFYYAQGDCALAQYFFQEALKRDAENVEALVGKGRALGCQGAFGSAVESFRAAIEADDDYVPAYVQLALAYQNQFVADPATYGGRLAEAIDVLRQAEQLAPQDPTVQNTKGIIYYESGDLEQARVTLERAVELA
jgi:tetratricopeptide (TPR) repeat protein